MSASTPIIPERRIFERFSSQFPVKFKDSRQDFGTDVFLRDTSASGTRIVTKERFFLQDRVSLEIKLPDGGSPMLLQGRVVWSKSLPNSAWELGLEFPRINLMGMNRMFKLTEKI